MMTRILTIGLALFLSSNIQAQNHTVSGHIQDSSSGEQLIGASVYCEDLKTGVAANVYGFYSLTLPSGKHNILVSFIGYTAQRFEVDWDSNIKLDINLVAGTLLSEAVVTGEAFNKIEDQVQMSKMAIPIDQIKRLPAIGGEVDLLKVLQLLPGIQSGGEGSTGLYVRGGSPDQNLILLDGVPLYSVNHLFGFFSVFNADAVRNMSITKGGFPARYGGRLSSILEIHMKDGHMKEYHVDATVSIISSKLTVEGPIVKDKASFMISGRRTYLDIVMGPLFNTINNSPSGGITTQPRYFFYDFNGKINWKVGDKDRLYFSAFSGKDDFGIETNSTLSQDPFNLDLGLDWKNSIQALRWNHEWGPRLFSNATLSHSQYNFNSGMDLTDDSNDEPVRIAALYNSGIQDFTSKIDFDFSPDPNHLIRFGTNATNHTFNPGANTVVLDFGQDNPLDTVMGSTEVKSLEFSAYLEDEFKVNDKLKINIGVHASSLFVQDTVYKSIQPRLALNYSLPADIAFKMSYASMTQYVNLLINDGVGLPTDLWVPSTKHILPQESWQVAMGFAKTFDEVEVSIEGYYKDMNNLLSYKEGASFIFNTESDWESQVTQGVGNSYGAELLVQKKYGLTTGWIGYTLSWSNRQFESINSGNWYPYTYDRRHDISIVLTHDFNDEWTGSAVWIYGTGRAMTLSDASFTAYIPDDLPPEIIVFTTEIPSEKNSFRLSPYKRLDFSLTRTRSFYEGEKSLIFSVYNATNHLNPFMSQISEDDNGNPVVIEYGIFPIIPSVAWSFTF